jgi:hypothetical protein
MAPVIFNIYNPRSSENEFIGRLCIKSRSKTLFLLISHLLRFQVGANCGVIHRSDCG